MFELALDDDWSEPEELDDAPVEGVGVDEEDGDDGVDGLDFAMLDELGGVVDDVFWRSLQATDNNAAAIATDSKEAFICFSFLCECGKTKGGPGERTPVVRSTYRPRIDQTIGTIPKGL